MAEMVGVFAATHGPLIARDWEKLTPATRARLADLFGALGNRVNAARADVLILVAPDHWSNFFITNYPAFCIGIGAENDGPPEPFMKPLFPHRVLPGHGNLARHLLRATLAHGFDPAFSHRLTLDHGFCLPLWRMGVSPLPAIVPIVVNSVEEPMPGVRRCLEFGRALGAAVASYPAPLRVALVATGGLSHSIGETTMGLVDEALDRRCLDLLRNGSDGALCAALEAALPTAGNGTHEIRNWVVARAAAGGSFDLVGYEALPEVYCGCAFGEWQVAPAAPAA